MTTHDQVHKWRTSSESGYRGAVQTLQHPFQRLLKVLLRWSDTVSLLPFEDQFFDVESQPSRLGTVYCVKVVGVLFRSHQCPISRVFVASLR